jgi:hypothetical protein
MKLSTLLDEDIMNSGNQTEDAELGDDFSKVFEDELKEIKTRRQKANFPPTGDSETEAAKENLVGLALSGGGIRSATFCLGLLQQLQEKNLLRIFDYLSTVSGGGFVGGWWSAWLSRDKEPGDGLFPAEEKSELDRHSLKPSLSEKPKQPGTDPNTTQKPEGAESAGHDPIHHLRLFANYLTPRKGALSQDTWRAVGIIARNLVMTWLVLLPIIVGLVLAGQLYFVLHTQQARYFIFYPPQDVTNNELMDKFASDRFENEIIEDAAGLESLEVKMTEWPSLKDKKEKVEEQWTGAHKENLERQQNWLEGRPLLKEARNHWMSDFQSHLREKGIWAEVLTRRLRVAVEPLIAILGWIVVMNCLWLLATLRFDSPDRSPANVESNLSAILVNLASLAAAVAAVLFILYSYYQSLQGIPRWLLDPEHLGSRILWTSIAFCLVVYAWNPWGQEELTGNRSERSKSRGEMRRNRINFIYTRLLMLLVVTAIVLAVAGFGHEVIKYSYGGVIGETKTGFGLLILVTALAGLMFTGYKARPRSGEDKQEQGRPSIVSRFVFAITPWLVVLVIAFTAAWVGHGVIADMWREHVYGHEPALIQYAKYASVVGITLCFILAWFEMKWESKRSPGWLYASLILPALTTVLDLVKSRPNLFNSQTDTLLIILALSVGILGVLFVILELRRFARRKTARRPRGLLRKWGSFFRQPAQLLNEVFDGVSPMNCVSGIVVVLIYAYWLYHEIFPGLKRFYDVTLLFAATLAGAYLLHRVMVIRVADDKFRSKIFDKPIGADRLPEAKRKAGIRKTAALCCVLAITASCVIGAFHYSLHRERQPVQAVSSESATENPKSAAGEAEWLHQIFEMFNVFEFIPKLLAEQKDQEQYTMYLGLPAASGFGALCILSLLGIRKKRKEKLTVRRALRLVVLAVGVLGFFYTVWMIKEVLDKVEVLPGPSNPLMLAGIVVCLAFTRFEIKWGNGTNRRSVLLLSIAYLALMALLIYNLIHEPNLHYRYEYGFGIFGLLVCTFTWLIGLGWLANPNVFSMHNFYKWRLVRAYLGASNEKRGDTDKDITDAAPGDDLLLGNLGNCERGAPYHLISATLNLVAGRDLALAQRSAASFVLSKNYCGSLRTHYRPTARYMGGQLSLGTAIAVSGAAASPNMGSRTPTSALAMLMTLLNVRLGYWVPTPNQEDWQSARPRLWPFYLIREFFSQTNDLSSYCYLTDGGHFDNSGIYPLVMRGCRFIVAADCGADPSHSLSDLGDAIRRCRIDFGAEIELHIEDFLSRASGESRGMLRRQFIVGKIHYSPGHIQHLTGKATARDGYIIIFKPSITGNDGADVRQYALQNPAFPHTTTANQWFGESQFESYRRLGELSAAKLFEKYTIAESLCHEQQPASTSEQRESSHDTKIKSIAKLFEGIYEEYRPQIS